MHEINLGDAKIKVGGEWLSAKDLADQIEKKIQAGDMKFSHLATALEELNKAIENSHIVEVKLTISRQDYNRLKALGGENDQEAVRKATLSFIKGLKQPEPSLYVKPTDAMLEEPSTEAAIEEPPAEPSPPANKTEAPVEETVKEPDKITAVNCFKCKSPIDINTDERPIDIECPNCNTTGRLDSSNKMKPRHQDHFLG